MQFMKGWADAELNAAEWMRRMGFIDAAPTPSGKDEGLDVVARSAAAQVKYIGVPVSSEMVQRLRGAAFDRDDALFFSTSGYDTASVAVADRCGVAL